MRIYRPRSRHKLQGVFYWICPGQIWITDSLHLRWQSEGLASRFVSWSKFADPFDDLEYNEALDERIDFVKVGECAGCGAAEEQVSKVEFSLRNDTPQPLIHGVGTSYVHANAKRTMEASGFNGFRFIPNSKQNISSDYWFLDASSSVRKVPAIIAGDERVCPNCKSNLTACSVCGEVSNKCFECHFAISLEEVRPMDSLGLASDGSDWPVKLSTWNLDDAVGGAYALCVTGELVEFMIANDFAPFAFGPIEVECDGSNDAQIERALKVKREIFISG